MNYITSNKEAFASELLENLKEMFPLYSMHSDLTYVKISKRAIVCYPSRKWLMCYVQKLYWLILKTQLESVHFRKFSFVR